MLLIYCSRKDKSKKKCKSAFHSWAAFNFLNYSNDIKCSGLDCFLYIADWGFVFIRKSAALTNVLFSAWSPLMWSHQTIKTVCSFLSCFLFPHPGPPSLPADAVTSDNEGFCRYLQAFCCYKKKKKKNSFIPAAWTVNRLWSCQASWRNRLWGEMRQ